MSYTETPDTPITVLEAVNAILEDAGRRPVASLTSPAFTPEAASAKRALDNASRTVQNTGWSFNTTDDVEMSADPTTGEVALPLNTLRFTPLNSYRAYGMDLVRRNNKVYDKAKQSYAIGQAIKGRLVELLPFEDLPDSARWYITCLAGYVFAGPRRPTQANARFTQAEVSSAKALAWQDEHDATDNDLADTSPHFRQQRKR